MQPFPVCALCSAPDALVAPPPLPRAAPARMAGQGAVRSLPRGYDRCAAGPLPSGNLHGNPNLMSRRGARVVIAAAPDRSWVPSELAARMREMPTALMVPKHGLKDEPGCCWIRPPC